MCITQTRSELQEVRSRMSKNMRWLTLGISGVSLVALVAACAPMLQVSVPGHDTARASAPMVPPSNLQLQADTIATPTSLAIAKPTLSALPQALATAPAAAPTPTPNSSRPTVILRRGTISDYLLANGRVGGTQEVPLSFSVDGHVNGIDVQVGQQIQAGQALLELDSGSLSKAISDLQNRIDVERTRLQAGQLLTQSQQQVAVRQAQDSLDQAQSDLARVQAGPSLADQKAAQGAVVAAQGVLDKANADLAHLKAGPSQADLRAAQGRVASAQLALQRDQTAQATLAKGPTPDQVQSAQRDLADASAGLAQVQGDLDRLTNPSPFDVQAAQRAVQVANSNLQATQVLQAGATGGLTKEQKDAQVTAANAALADAKDKLSQLQKAPSQAALESAKARVDAAKLAQAAAQSRLTALQNGPDKSALDAAAAQMHVDQVALAAAEQQLKDLQAPPSNDQLNAAQSVVDGAQLALDGAQAKKADLLSHPTADELAHAQARVTNAQTAVRQAQAGSLSPDDLAARQTLNQDMTQLSSLQAQLAASQLTAPADGIVVAIQVQQGDAVQANKPVLLIAPVADAVIRTVVNAPGGNSPIVSVGQNASVQLDGGDGSQLSGQVVSISPNPDGPGDVALIRMAWGILRPVFGTTAQIRLEVRHKSDALILPTRAVRSDGDKHYVDYLDGTTRRNAEVTVGITDGSNVEILSGLDEGHTVLLGDGAA